MWPVVDQWSADIWPTLVDISTETSRDLSISWASVSHWPTDCGPELLMRSLLFMIKVLNFSYIFFFISVMFESKRIKASRQPLTSFDDFMCWNQNWRSQWWSFSSKSSIFFLNNYLTIQWLWEIINSINSWVAIKKIFSQIFTDYKDEIYADDLQEGWKFIGRKKVRHPSY